MPQANGYWFFIQPELETSNYAILLADKVKYPVFCLT